MVYRRLTFLRGAEEVVPPISSRFNARIAKNYITGKKLLDVGCWTGNFISLLKSERTETAGIDIEEKVLRFAKKRLPGVFFICGTALNMPFREGYFDIVACWDVIEHLPQKEDSALLFEINKVLKNGGFLLLSTMNGNLLGRLLDPAYFLIGHRHYSEEYLGRLFAKSGFIIEKIYYTTGVVSMLDGILFLIFKHLLRIKKPPSKFIEAIKEKEFSCAEGKSKFLFRSHFILKKLHNVER
jgi:ubiquinone/menaquinone biosynthesis C-methylase UbiE